MEKDLFKEAFGFYKEDYDRAVKVLSKIMEEFFGSDNDEAKKSDDDKNDTYFREKGCHYENGKLVEKYDKEYVNGKCTKDIDIKTDKAIGDCGCECKGQASSVDDNLSCLRKKCDNYKNQINDMKLYTDSLNDHIKELEIKNRELQEIVNKAKNIFK